MGSGSDRDDSTAWDVDAAMPPWGQRGSLYAHIRNHIRADTTGLTKGGLDLPDETMDPKRKFVPGALDGAFWNSRGNESRKAARAAAPLAAALASATEANLARLYDALRENNAFDYVDALLAALARRHDLDRQRLRALAVWLARRAPDREPVKIALALLGLVGSDADRELLLTLGRHDELTLYAVIALGKIGDHDRDLFELAQHVGGWGRIQVVRRLAGAGDPRIKAWLLRHGYQNSVMHEYLAYTCAVTGDLRAELSRPAIDTELLDAAGDLISALITGCAAEGMSDYADGPAVTQLYLRHLGVSPRALRHLLVVGCVLRFVDDARDRSDDERRSWTPELRASLRAHCAEVMSQGYWPAVIREALSSTDRGTFVVAIQAASLLGIDTWEQCFARLQTEWDSYVWSSVMQTSDPERIDRVLSLAEQRIPLDEIATGPARQIGVGPPSFHQSQLTNLLPMLSRYPGKGWPLLRAGIRSPDTSDRYFALIAFSRWGTARWPSDARKLLIDALWHEPDDQIRPILQTVLEGGVLKHPELDDADPED